MDKVRGNLKKALDDAGINMTEASRLLGKNHAYIQQFITTGKPYRLPEIVRIKLSELLNIDEASLGAPMKSDNFTQPLGLPVRVDQYVPFKGAVAAGLWLDHPIEDQDKHPPMLSHPDPKYRDVAQYYMLVTGNSMDKYILDGDYVICVEYENADVKPATNGKVVVVTCKEGGKTENSLRRVKLAKNGDYELFAESSNKAFNQPLNMTSPKEGLEIIVTGLVIGRLING